MCLACSAAARMGKGEFSLNRLRISFRAELVEAEEPWASC